jgi:hypothetical protein
VDGTAAGAIGGYRGGQCGYLPSNPSSGKVEWSNQDRHY